MFERLIESRATGIRPGVSIVWSALLHTLLAVGALLATRQAAFLIEPEDTDLGVVWLEPPLLPPSAERVAEPAEANDVAPTLERWFESIPAIIEVPTDLPPPVLKDRFSPAHFSGAGAERSRIVRTGCWH